MADSLEKVQILVVDDREDKVLALTAMLQDLGEEVIGVNSGEEALRRLLNEDFAVILLDINMPGMNGLEVARLIRSRMRSASTPIIFLSAADLNDQDVRQAYALGAVDFLPMPVHADVLRAKVAVFVELHRLRMRAEQRFHTSEIARKEYADHVRAIIDTALDCVVSIDENSIIVDWNPQAERTFGWPATEAVGRRLPDMIIPPQYREAHLRGLKRYLESGEGPVLNKRLELSALRRNGEEFPIELSIAPTRSAGRRLFSAFLRDITDRKQATEELARRAEALQHANTELEQFAYVSAHDLQEPLRMVTQYMGLLQRRHAADLNDQAKHYIGCAVDGALRMHALIHDLLDYSRVGSSGMRFDEVDLNDLLSEVMGNLKVAIAESKARISVRQLPVARGDRARLSRLLQNLIANAIKFSGGKEPEIMICAERGAGELTVAVQDNGIGIDPEFTDRIFEIFQRLHPRDEYPGTGIGLAICKKVVEQHGGRIWVESQSGQGATFKFTLRDGTAPEAMNE